MSAWPAAAPCRLPTEAAHLAAAICRRAVATSPAAVLAEDPAHQPLPDPAPEDTAGILERRHTDPISGAGRHLRHPGGPIAAVPSDLRRREKVGIAGRRHTEALNHEFSDAVGAVRSRDRDADAPKRGREARTSPDSAGLAKAAARGGLVKEDFRH